MGRRPVLLTRDTIGTRYVQLACAAINIAGQTEAAMLVGRTQLTPQLIDSLFKAEHLEKLRAAFGLSMPSSWLRSYNLRPHLDSHLSINFQNTGTLTPNAELLAPSDAAKPLFAKLQEIREIHIRWGAVKHMLRWFNCNGTAGLIRAYWPAVMNLCPDSPAVKAMREQTSERYATPEGLREMLPLIRQTAGTVATMQLLSDRKGNDNRGLFLTVSEGHAMVEGVKVDLDHLTYNL